MTATKRGQAAPRWEVWMLVKDHRKLTALIKAHGLSTRQFADQLGWKAHSYLQRLMNGQVRSVKQQTATLIAWELGVPVDALFVTKVTENAGRSGRKAKTAA